MFDKIKGLFAYGKTTFERCLKEPDVNSRLVFLLTALVTSAIMIAHTVIYAKAFLTTGRTDPSYPTILGVLAAGHGVNGVARYMTKKNGDPDQGDNNKPDDTKSDAK